MAEPRFVQSQKTFLRTPISSTDTEIVLDDFVDLSGDDLEMADFGDKGYITINPGNDNEEIISFTGFTVNDDGSVTLDTGVTRGLESTYPYGTDGTAHPHGAGDVVVVSNTSHLLDQIITYVDNIAIAGSPDADETTKGVMEVATSSEIDNGKDTGSTGADLAVTPDQLGNSKYSKRLPSTEGDEYLSAIVGTIMPTVRVNAPSGFLLCQGQSVSNQSYKDLASVIAGRYGLGNSTDFTVDTNNDEIDANSHGLSNGDLLLLTSDGTLPSPFSENTAYYVINASANSFQLASSSGGSPISITDTGSGTHSFNESFRIPDLRSSVPLGRGQRVETFDFEDSDVDTGNDEITVRDNDWLKNGTEVTLSNSGGSLPSGLSSGTYYVIRVNSTTVKLASSRSDVDQSGDNSSAIDITGASGGGTHTITLTLSSRSLSDAGGEEEHQSIEDEMPSHYHGIASRGDSNGWNLEFVTTTSNNDSDSGTPTQRQLVSERHNDRPATERRGSDNPHNNMPPYTVINYMIKT